MCAHDPAERKPKRDGKMRCAICHRDYARMWRRRRSPTFLGLTKFARMVWQ